MNNLMIFKNEQFGQVRMVELNNKPYFVGKDIAKSLGYKNPRDAISRHCKGVVKHDSFKEGGQCIALITEGDMYRLITNSELKSAEKFEGWVFDEVLPSIRKHGAYMTDNTLEKALTSPDFLIQLATNLKEEQEKRRLLEEEKKLNAPKVVFADAVSTSHTSILVGDLAKLIKQNGVDIGGKRLFSWLRENGYLIKRKGTDYNMPTQKSMELELFEVKETVINHSDGHITTNRTPKVTGKGQQYFINKFLS
ncbi:phage antirepressor [Clostridium perfringens]|uniref:phage antirepressor n=1 Tax=Clostridium perfringens TaxID=1502 RepID=UPI0030CB6631